MNVFFDIEGLRGEELSSGLLKYLLNNSTDAKTAIINLLTSKLEKNYSVDGFKICETERTTEDNDLGSGRLDLFIELDDLIIGIENKFFADFNKNQPEKYIKTLKEKANNSHDYILFVLCPESRRDEVNSLLQHRSDAIKLITWENVINALNGIDQETYISDFINFVKRKIEFLTDFNKILPSLRDDIDSGGNENHKEFLGAISEFFPETTKLSWKNGYWLGYNFYSSKQCKYIAWYGFVPADKIIGYVSENAVELVIESTYVPQNLDDLYFEVVDKGLDNSVKRETEGPLSTWVVKFTDDWNDAGKWKARLKPFGQVCSEPK